MVGAHVWSRVWFQSVNEPTTDFTYRPLPNSIEQSSGVSVFWFTFPGFIVHFQPGVNTIPA